MACRQHERTAFDDATFSLQSQGHSHDNLQSQSRLSHFHCVPDEATSQPDGVGFTLAPGFDGFAHAIDEEHFPLQIATLQLFLCNAMWQLGLIACQQ
jgi:hypothetical protein